MYLNQATPRYDVVEFLGDIHNKLNKKYNFNISNKEQNKEWERAQKIQEFLRVLPTILKKNDSLIAKVLYSNLKSIMGKDQESFSLFERMKERSTDPKDDVGDVFEKELQAIIQTFFEVEGRPIRLGEETVELKNVQQFLEANQQGFDENLMATFRNIQAERIQPIIDDLIEQGLKKGTKDFRDALKKDSRYVTVPELGIEYYKNQTRNNKSSNRSFNIYNLFPKTLEYYKEENSDGSKIKLKTQHFVVKDKSGKTDVAASDITIDYELEGEFSNTVEAGIKALKGARLSAKSYSDFKIGLGNTNFLKVFYAVADATGQSSETRVRHSALYHLLNLQKCAKNKKEKKYKYKRIKEEDRKPSIYDPRRYGKLKSRWTQAREYIYYLRFIYELTGAGTKYTKKELRGLEEVDFLVTNIGKGKESLIQVFPVSYLIQKAIISMQKPGALKKYTSKRPDPFDSDLHIDFSVLDIPML